MKQKTKLKRMLSLLFVAICASTVAFGVGASAWSLMASPQSQGTDEGAVATGAASYAAPAKAPAATRTFEGLAETTVAVIPDGDSYREYTDLTEAFYDAIDGETVVLVKDLDISVTSGSEAYCAEIPNSITFDGNGNTLTVNRRGISVAPQSNNVKAMFGAPAAPSTYALNVTIQNVTIQNTAAQSRGYGGRCITTRGKLGSLALDNVVLTTDGSAYNNTLSPLFIGGSQNTAAVINVTNSSIITDAAAAKGDAITTINPVALTITSSTLTAANVVNFGEADDSAGSNGSTVNVTDGSTLTASVAAFHFYDNNIAVDLASSTVEGNVAEFGSTSDNTVTIAGGQFSEVVDDAFLAEGYICHKVATDGLYLVEEGTYTCYIDEVGYPTLAEAIACAEANDEIVLHDDLTLEGTDASRNAFPEGMGIKKSLTINGQDHTITPVSGKRALYLEGEGIDVTLKNLNIVGNGGASGPVWVFNAKSLTLDNTSIDGSVYGGSYNQPLTINAKSAVELNIVNGSEIKTNEEATAHYAVIAWTQINATVDDSSLKGWAVFYMKAAGAGGNMASGANGSTITINNSTLTSKNIYAGTTNSFSMFDIEAENVAVNITNSQINVSSTTDQYQAITSFSNKAGNAITLGEGNTVTMTGDKAIYAFATSESSVPSLEVQAGTTSNVEIPEAYCADGLIPVRNADGTYGVKEGTFIVDDTDRAAVGVNSGYESIAQAIGAGAQNLKLRTDAASEGVFASAAFTTTGNLNIDLKGLTLQADIELGDGLLTFSNGQVKGTATANGGSLVFDESCGTNDIAFSGSALNLTSGKFASDIDEQFLAEHYATNLISGAYVVKATIQIATVEDLQALATLCNSGSTSGQTIGNTYELTADLDLSGVNWTPIGGLDSYPGTAFKGTFDGKDHTISNLTCSDTHANYATAGLFGGVVGATIKNLTLTNVNIQSTHYAAAIVAYTSDGISSVVNCHVNGGSIVSSPELVDGSYDNGDKVGTIFGYANNANIENCSVEGVTLQAYRDLGGLAGYMNGGSVEGNTIKDVTLTQSNENAYKWVDENDHSKGNADMSGSVGEVVGGRSASAVQTQANDVAQNTTDNVVITEPVYIVKIGTATYATLAAAVAAAKEGDVVEIYKADTYTMPNLPQNITIKGAVAGVVFNCEGAYGSSIASVPNGATFENVTMNFGTNDYHGFQHAGTINMKDCTLNGKFFSYADMNFNGCTFNAPGTDASGYSSKDYSMWAYSGNLLYTYCTFNCAGKCVNVYNEDGSVLYNVKAEYCTFNSTIANKAAFNVKATCGTKPLAFEVVVEDCEATGSWPAASTSESLVVLNSLVQVDDINAAVASVTDIVEITTDEATSEKVEKVLYTTRVAEYAGNRYDTLAEAIDAAETAGDKNIVINLLNDATLDITAWDGTKNALSIGTAETESITINGDNHTLNFNKKNSDWNNVATMNDAQTKLILNDMTLTDSGYNNGPWNRYDINFNCAVELNNVTSTKAIALKNGATLNNVTVNDNNDVYGIWIQTNGQEVTMNDVTVNVPNGRGIAVKDQYVNTAPAETTSLTITDATFNTAKKAAILVTAKYGAEIEASNLDIENVAADNVNAVWVDEDLANQYGEITFISDDETMVPEGGVSAYTVVRSTGEKVEGYYTDLAKAVSEAEDGQTITLKADFNLAAAYLMLDKGITIDGQGHSITSSAAQALFVAGTGDVTIANTAVNATAGNGIKVGDGTCYEGTLSLTDGTVVTVAKRGINVLDVTDDFRLVLNNAIIQSNVLDPTQTYTTGEDSRGISFSNVDASVQATITDSEIRGFSYVVNVYTSTQQLRLTMTGGKTYGRAALNVWGSNNTFTLDGVEVHGLNNQTGPTEAFACIVENTGATGNTYNINNCPFIATLSEAAMSTSDSSATQQMVDLRGTGSTMNITGETTYTCNSEERGGLLSNEAALQNNNIALDATAKESLADELDDLTVTIVSDVADENGMYSLAFQGVAHLYSADFSKSKFFYTLKEALENDEIFENGTQIDLLANVTVDEDITVNLQAGEEFAIDCGAYTLSAGAGHILLPTGVAGSLTKASDVFATVEARDDVVAATSAIASDYYTHCYVAGHHEVAYTADGEADYRYFEEVFGEGSPAAGATITLQKDITLVQSVSSANSFTLNLDGYALNRAGYTITLANDVTVTTDEQVADYADFFVPADATYMVVEAQDGEGYTYTVVTKNSQGIYELADADGSYAQTADAQAEKVTYTRSYGEERVGKHQPWLLPFDYTITAEDAEQFTFYKINMIANAPEAGVSEESDKVWIFITPMKAGDVLRGNKPYLYVPTSAVDDYQFVSENVTLKAKTNGALISTETMKNRYSFYGTYGPTTLNDDNFALYMGTSGKLSYPDGQDITIGVFRWILKVEDKDNGEYVREIEFTEGDDATGIRFVEDGTEGETYYTLDGKKIQKPGRGVYVKKTADGEVKKVYIK